MHFRSSSHWSHSARTCVSQLRSGDSRDHSRTRLYRRRTPCLVVKLRHSQLMIVVNTGLYRWIDMHECAIHAHVTLSQWNDDPEILELRRAILRVSRTINRRSIPHRLTITVLSISSCTFCRVHQELAIRYISLTATRLTWRWWRRRGASSAASAKYTVHCRYRQ